MAKDTYYFTHDYNTRSDNKVKRLILKHGMAGYGVFWSIVEDLYNNANALPTDYELIAFDLRVNEDLVKSVINDFELFVIDGSTFGSTSVERRLNERNEKSLKAKRSAELRWKNKKETDANALQPQTDGNAIKEKKGNEIKENESKVDSSVEVSTSPPKQTKKTIDERKQIFYDKVAEFKNDYSKEMLRNFFEYWTEHGDDDHKMRFEKQKTFGISLRLKTWDKNDKTFNNGKSNTTTQTADERLNARIEANRLRLQEKFGLNK